MSDEPATSPLEAAPALGELVRASGRDVLATLARWTGDLALAEDAVQDASLTALQVWPRDGVPDNPVAWLRLTARRRAVDLLRREIARRPKEVAAMADARLHDLQPDGPEEHDDVAPSVVDDDLLRLVFTCCHPSLALEAQVALALRTLCGLTVAEVARALLVSEPAMAKRLVRTRQKISAARIPYRVPPDHELPDRWAGVLATVHLVLNEGHTATAGDDLVRQGLVDQAIGLARLLHRLQPDDPGAMGLLALGLLLDSRRLTRTGPDGVVLLADQDRALWDRGQIAEAVSLLGEALRRTPTTPDRYVVQAAIAACHALAPTWEDTDWAAVVSWYDTLVTIDPSPVVLLNRAVAIGERDGAEAGLLELESVDGLDHYSLWHAARGGLLRRAGRDDLAREAELRAAELPMSDPQRRVVLRHLDGDAGGPDAE
jgi:RNA polymerase sigma-70 factor (ECF subfamily)